MSSFYPTLASHTHGMFYDPWAPITAVHTPPVYDVSYKDSKFTVIQEAMRLIPRTPSTVELAKLRSAQSIKEICILPKSVVAFFDPEKNLNENCWIVQRASVDPLLLEIPTAGAEEEVEADVESPQAKNPPRFTEIGLTFEQFALETGSFSSDLDRFETFIKEVRQFILESHDRRTRIQAYGKLFHPSCLSHHFFGGRTKLAQAKKELFSMMPLDFQEDIKYALWKMNGSPDTLGSDHGRWLFDENPHSDDTRLAVKLASRRPRYCAKGDDETLSEQYTHCMNLAETLKTSRTTLSELYVYQGFELAKAEAMIDTARLVSLFFQCVQEEAQGKVFSMIQSLDSHESLEVAKESFRHAPLSCTSLRAIRAIKHERIDYFNTLALAETHGR